MVDISCETCPDLLGDYADGILSDPVRDALEAHVSACARCATLVREYRALPEFVRRLTDTEMPYDVEVRLRRLLAFARRTGH